jgi:predicted amidohydrolase YtcJ
MRIILDVYEEVVKRHPNMPQGTLVIEHGGLASAEQRARARRLTFLLPSNSRCFTTLPAFPRYTTAEIECHASSQYDNGLTRVF